MAAPQYGFLTALDAQNDLVGVADQRYIGDTSLGGQIARGRIQELGEITQSSPESLLALRADGIFLNSVTEIQDQQTSLPLIYTSEWLEMHPLGRAEWLLFFGVLTGKLSEAQEVFQKIESNYFNLASQAQTRPPVSCFTGTPFKGTWYMARGESYLTKLLSDAGAKHLWADTPGTGSLALDVEAVYARAQDADFWVDAQASSRKELEAIHPLFVQFDAFRSGQILTYAHQLNAYWTHSATEPDQLLADLVSFFHPDLLPDHESKYYKKCND